MPILFIGESGEIRDTLSSSLRAASGDDLTCCAFDQVSSLQRLVSDEVHLVIVGLQQPHDAEIVPRVLAEPSVANQVPVVVFAEAPSGEQVLNWLRLGALAVELWPCQPSRISFLLDYLTVGRRSNSVQLIDHRVDTSERERDETERLIFASPVMQRLIDQIHRVAPLDVNVLLSGETGVGKTRLASLLHDRSRRQAKPFFAVNCGALPENLLESELFGHQRGAFTGAEAERKGRFEGVGQGTLFLDEVDSIPISSQCKLLRAIENRVFEPLGSNVSIKFRGRIVAASNARLEKLIQQGQFRADLFYRLGVVDLYIPPLRERREDIRPIAEAMLKTYTTSNALSARSISQEVMELLETYNWPGNVRQLRNVIASSASLCRYDEIGLSDVSGRWLADARQSARSECDGESRSISFNAKPLLEPPAVQESGCSLAESRAKLEADRISKVLREVGNNRTKAAIELGISRTMLYKKLAKYSLVDAR